MKLMHKLSSHAGAVAAVTLAMTLIAPYGADATLTLIETGGTFGPNDLATQGGAVAFAKDVLGAGTIPAHQIAHLNDGLYGNEKSWIGATIPSFAGIDFAGTGSFTINRVAFGRDNTGEFTLDRYTGTYDIQYTTVPNPNATTPSGSWTSIGILDYVGSPPPSPSLRHLWEFGPVTATGIRVITDGGTSELAIDELEVYEVPAVPEPATVTLLGLGGLLLVNRGRKTSQRGR